ncbi:MAG: hypothetical protein VYC39_12840, partial [Myxococcota bacterium]|nr:hypothetical protein [Myxococcota bacterium]
MTLRMLKENIAGNLNRYLVGRHDEGKKRIARNANAFVSAAESFSDLAAGLDAYRTELLRYVANRNRRRMFAHRAGALERYLRS